MRRDDPAVWGMRSQATMARGWPIGVTLLGWRCSGPPGEVFAKSVYADGLGGHPSTRPGRRLVRAECSSQAVAAMICAT
jgi:hypothetical protein